MHAENPVLKTLTPVARLLALLAGYLLLGLAVLITAEILMRRFMNMSLQGGDEFGGYVLAILAAFGFSYALIERSHTRVEILVERVGWRTQSVLNVISSWCIAAMAAFMAWRAYAALDESLEFQSLSGTPLMTPLWQPQSLWFIGLLFFGVIATVIAVHSSLLLIRDPRRLNRLYGIKTLDEIIEEETVLTEDTTGAIKP
jgi:TRAP-type C4-dicarboxylate transport system permease small subunit